MEPIGSNDIRDAYIGATTGTKPTETQITADGPWDDSTEGESVYQSARSHDESGDVIHDVTGRAIPLTDYAKELKAALPTPPKQVTQQGTEQDTQQVPPQVPQQVVDSSVLKTTVASTLCGGVVGLIVGTIVAQAHAGVLGDTSHAAAAAGSPPTPPMPPMNHAVNGDWIGGGLGVGAAAGLTLSLVTLATLATIRACRNNQCTIL